MKGIRAISGTFLVIGGVILAIIVSSSYGIKYAVLRLTQDFWIPVILLVMTLSAMALFLTMRTAAKKGGKKGIFPAIIAVLFALGAVFFGYHTVYCINHIEAYRFEELQSPEGLHAIWRTERTDWFGNTCYEFYQQDNAVMYTYLFDWDREVPNIDWQASGLEFREQFFAYTD
ncbi:MAG: hypothetical protein IKQ39_03050 [Oscillospiraceae bacterium]|nr:hypothetical protein [Oscillospiraceae bacterium]